MCILIYPQHKHARLRISLSENLYFRGPHRKNFRLFIDKPTLSPHTHTQNSYTKKYVQSFCANKLLCVHMYVCMQLIRKGLLVCQTPSVAQKHILLYVYISIYENVGSLAMSSRIGIELAHIRTHAHINRERARFQPLIEFLI